MPRSNRILNLIGVLSLLASIWLVREKFDLLNSQLNSITTAAIFSILVLIAYFSGPIRNTLKIRRLYKRIMQTIDFEGLQGLREKASSGYSNRNKFFHAFERLRYEGVDLSKYPVFVVVADNPDDVEKLITDTSLTPVLGEAPIKPISGVFEAHSLRWWIAREAIVIDLASTRFADHAGDQGSFSEWKNIVPFLRQLGNNIVDGVIVMVSTQDLVADSNQEAKRVSLKIHAQLKSLAETLNQETPFFLFVNQIENIEGFSEYRKYCVGNKSDDTLGFCKSPSKNPAVYLENYKQMLSQLYRILPTFISAVPTKEQKIKLNTLPHLLSALSDPLKNLLSSILNNKIHLSVSGLYFTSVNSAYGFSAGAMTRVMRAHRKGGDDVVNKGLVTFRVAVLTLAAIAFSVWSYILVDTYRFNDSAIQKKSTQLVAFSRIKRPDSRDLLAVVKYLDQVDALGRNDYLYSNQIFPRLELLVLKRIRVDLADFYKKEVNSLYPPALLYFLERDIATKDINEEDAYKGLTAYMGLKRFNKKDRIMLANYISKRLQLSKNTPPLKSFYRHYQVLEAEQLQAKIRLNYIIVNKLQSKADSKWLLKLLRKRIAIKVTVIKKAPVKFSALFVPPVLPYIENTYSSEIPYIYTTKGYSSYVAVVEQELSKLKKSSWVLREDGLSDKGITALKKQLLSEYINKYSSFWQATIKGLRLKSFSNRDQALVFLNTIGRHPDIFVTLSDVALKNLKAVALNSQAKSLIDEIIDLKIRSDIPAKTTELYAALKIKDKIKVTNIIKKINDTGGKSGKLKLNLYFTHLAGQIKRSLFGSEKDKIVSIYKSKVLPLCRSIKSKYPFNRKSEKTSNLRKFHQLFSEKGRIEKFFTLRLKKYMANATTFNHEGKLIGLNTNILKLRKVAREIRKNTFEKDKFRIRYKLRPKLLDSRANQIVIELGEKKFSYRHGAQLDETVIWPPQGKKNNIRFSFYLPGQTPISEEIKSSDWSFYRMVDQSLEKRSSIVFKSGDYRAEYSASVVDKEKYTALNKLIKDFRCPRLFNK